MLSFILRRLPAYSFIISSGVGACVMVFLAMSCAGGRNVVESVFNGTGTGGGQDSIAVAMPFYYGYASQCTQGVGGSYSHTYNSTYFDVDLDTPNCEDDYVFAPVSGVLYVHDSGESGFGLHVNIEMEDETYIVLGHLAEVFVGDREEVAAGQLIGYEGSTGDSTGDHVHMGRHTGDASEDAAHGTSIEGLRILAIDSATDEESELLTGSMTCDLSWGHSYTSVLETTMWHPNGTLIKTPESSTVYIIENGEARAFVNEEVFWSLNYDFDDLSLVTQEELACYLEGEMVYEEGMTQAVYDNGAVWLLHGFYYEPDSYRERVNSNAWQAVAKSWGITASTYDDLPAANELGFDIEEYSVEAGSAEFRDGTLVKESDDSTVYVVADSVAMPIESWDAYLMMGFYTRQIIEVDPGAVAEVQRYVGSCEADSSCVREEDIVNCIGGSGFAAAGASSGSDDGSERATNDTEDYEPEDREHDREEGAEDDSEGDGSSEESDEEEGTNKGEEEPEEEGVVPDDLGEDLTWIRVDKTSVGLKVSEVFDSVDPFDIAVTGTGLGSGWGYSTSYLVYYDEDTDYAWYDFGDGQYRVSWRTAGDWALYWQYCIDASTASNLCYENSDGSYALCFAVFDESLWPLADRECEALE